jgi:hypothetical protein
MNADFLFETGDSHKVCEDYGRQGASQNSLIGDYVYIVQSDGCSDPKSPDTDFGSRLLVKSAENLMLAGALNSGEGAVTAAQTQARAIGLHPNCIDATLIVARSYAKTRTTQVMMWGDGVVSAKMRDGGIRIFVVESPISPSGDGSIPFYISYTLDPVRLANYKAAGTPMLAVHSFDADGKPTGTERNPAADHPIVLAFGHDTCEAVATFSDGAESFYYRDPKNGLQIAVPVEQVVLPLTKFAGFAGEFVRRQYNIFNRMVAGPGKWKHYDDLSYGAIYHGEP